MLTDYAGLRIVRHPMQPLQRRVFELRHNFTAYDAMYVTLAETFDIPLLTDDGKFAATPGHHAYPDWRQPSSCVVSLLYAGTDAHHRLTADADLAAPVAVLGEPEFAERLWVLG
jgi:hypothetical protein